MRHIEFHTMWSLGAETSLEDIGKHYEAEVASRILTYEASSAEASAPTQCIVASKREVLPYPCGGELIINTRTGIGGPRAS